MAAPLEMLCSTFLNATSAPDFPADISAFCIDRHLKEEPAATKTLIANNELTGRNTNGEKDLQQSIRDGALPEMSIASSFKTIRERDAQVAQMRLTDPYLDKLEKMREISSRARARKACRNPERAGGSASVPASASASAAVTSSADDSGIGNALEVVRLCDQLLRKTALISLTKCEKGKEMYWNDSGVRDLLCPKKVDKDIQQLEQVVSRLHSLMRDIPKMAVDLQKPAAPSLRLDPQSHEAAAKLLGDSGLKLVVEIVNAMEKVELFLKGIKSSSAEEFVRESEHNRNLVELVIATLARATGARAHNGKWDR